MKAPEQITKVGLQIQKLNCVGLQIRRNWKSFDDFFRIKDIDYDSPLTKRSIY